MSVETPASEANASSILEQSPVFKDLGSDPSRISMASWESVLRDICIRQERASLDSATIKSLLQWAAEQNASNLSSALREFNNRFNLGYEKAALALFEELEVGDAYEEATKAFRGIFEELVAIKKEYDALKAEYDKLQDHYRNDLDADIYLDEFMLKHYNRMQELEDTILKNKYILNRLREEYHWIDELENIYIEMQGL